MLGDHGFTKTRLHPESWLRDAKLDYWNAATEQWVPIMPLLSDAAIHTHVFPQPVEAARFRIVLPDGLYGNLQAGAGSFFHGEALQDASHPDVVARRPDRCPCSTSRHELKDSMMFGTTLSFDFKTPFSGGRCTCAPRRRPHRRAGVRAGLAAYDPQLGF